MIHLTGTAHAQTMYVAGDDPLDVNIESLALDAKDLEEGMVNWSTLLAYGCTRVDASCSHSESLFC